MRINSKGFTILEVIIAMAILSVVLFVGYSVINGSNKTTDSQKYTTKGQLSTNLVNKYVSKDIEILEPKKDIEFKNNGMTIESGSNKYTQSYTYTIDTVNHDEGGSIVDKVDYEVIHEGEIKDNNLNGIYSVNRKSKKEDGSIFSDLELVSNQKTMYIKESDIGAEEFLINGVRPFDIYKDDEDANLYTVGVHYESNNKEKDYTFNISPRMSLATIEIEPPIDPPVDPEIDPDFDGNSAYIRFKQENGLAWSDAGPKGNSANNKEGQKYEPLSNVYKIYAKIYSGTSNGKVETNMGEGSSMAEAQNNKEFPKENYNQIKFSLYGDASLEDLTIKVVYKSGNGQKPIFYEPILNGTIDETTKIDIKPMLEGKGQSYIEIDGKLKIKEGSKYGDVIINLGHAKVKAEKEGGYDKK